MLRDRAAIEHYIKMNMLPKQAYLHPDFEDDGSVSFDSFVDLSSRNLKELPFRLGTVGGSFNVSKNKLSSFEGFPHSIHHILYMDHNNFESLHNIHKHVKSCASINVRNNPLTKSCLLGLFFIDNLQYVDLCIGRAYKLFVIENIINDHPKGDRNVHQCQEELIKAGFAEYAKL